MAKLEFRGRTWTNPQDIKNTLSGFNIPFESWGVRYLANSSPATVLATYATDVGRLKSERGYLTEDVIALDPDTENLSLLLAKFLVEHHHTDDEVRFVVAGEGVFEINVTQDERVKITAQPGDLIVVPAWRRHLFYLTELQTIRCIRLFKDKSGWEAQYPYAAEGSNEFDLHFAQ
ncbi:MAG: cupin domain-containing protein [Proteobacteria bacterium]|nr:cupin domain-containing protein [Pseudomonadota bacterium]